MTTLDIKTKDQAAATQMHKIASQPVKVARAALTILACLLPLASPAQPIIQMTPFSTFLNATGQTAIDWRRTLQVGNGTNWLVTNVTYLTNASGVLYPQPASANLTNWSTLSTNVLATGGGGGSGSSGTNVILVSADTGNDATGQRGTGNAFKTIEAAFSNAVNNSFIQVLPGVYKLTCDTNDAGFNYTHCPAHLSHLTNITITGYGAIVVCTNYGDAIILGAVENVVISGITFNGDWQSYTNGNSIAGCLSFAETNRNVAVYDCVFNNWPDQVITTVKGGFDRNVLGLQVSRNRFYKVGNPAANWVNGGTQGDGSCISGLIQMNAIVTDNVAGRCQCFFECGAGGVANGTICSNIVVANNIITESMNTEIIIASQGGVTNPVYKVLVANNIVNYIPGAGLVGIIGGIFLQGVRDGIVSGNSVNDFNDWGGNFSGGISIQGSSAILVQNNVLDHCSPTAINLGAGALYYGCSDFLVAQNNVIRNSYSMGITAGATNTVIADNTFVDYSGDNAGAIAIQIASSTNMAIYSAQGWTKNAVVRGNTLMGNWIAMTSFVAAMGSNTIGYLEWANNRNFTLATDISLNTPNQTLNNVQRGTFLGDGSGLTNLAGGGGFIPTNTDGTIVIMALNGSITNIELANTNMFIWGTNVGTTNNRALTLANGGLMISNSAGRMEFWPDSAYGSSGGVINYFDMSGTVKLRINTNGAIAGASYGFLTFSGPALSISGYSMTMASGQNTNMLSFGRAGEKTATNACLYITNTTAGSVVAFVDGTVSTNINVGIRTIAPQAALHVNGLTRSDYGYSSWQSNRLSVASLSPTGGSATWNWTNYYANNVYVFLGGGSISAVSINGTSLGTGQTNSGLMTIPLQTNEWVTATYSSPPTATVKPW